ncbi:hypothetical protein NONO_c58220 [Nocardia nova SH22a]|uniref:PPE family domain-containing protein n=1 Tax=Nocardia nova SH22a TaxID=1415166 RepID=W5TN84_9NOCA|nr:hypothetical protein [Nocardia nova]AHH20599.1 hypothetical protein NONO_c58220 [Nocardia nova SH22a]
MTGNENRRITDGGEHTDSWSHWKIYNAFVSLNTTEANNGRGEFEQIAQRWNSAAELFAARIHNSSSAAWSGPAAESTREAVRKYAERALDLVGPLNELSQRVSSTVDGVDKTRNAVDRPPDGGSWYNPRSWSLGPMHGPSSASVRHDCENAARDAMRDHYVAQFTTADGQIPILPVPDNPADPLYKPEKPTGYVPPTGPSPSPSPSGPAPAPNPGQPGNQPGDTTQNPTSTNPASTTPASTDPAANTPTVPSSVNPSGSGAQTTPSGLSSGGGGYPGGGLGGLSGGTTPGGGRSVPGSPAAGKPGAVAAGLSGAKAGTSGMPGMGGMGGAKGKGEGEEKTHDLPEWLRNMENAEELLGPAPRTIPGGVIGGDYTEPPPASS